LRTPTNHPRRHVLGEDLTLFPLKFNGSVRVEARPERLTSDAGVLALREIFERLGLSDLLVERLEDDRSPEWITYPLPELVRTVVLMLALGYRDLDDADALRDEAALRLAVSDRKGISPLHTPERPESAEPPRNPAAPEHLASQPTLSRMTSMLASKRNREGLSDVLFECAARRFVTLRGGHRQRHITIDVDSLPAEVHGHQPEAAYNGHYGATVYHPLVASVAETGDLLGLDLRRGNCHTAEGALEFVVPILEKAERHICQVAALRIDAGFPDERLLGPLEARGTPYVARVRNNRVLDRMADPYLHRPVGRRPKEPRTWFYEMTYQAKDWSRARRVVLVVLEREEELFLHKFWLITNWTPEQMDGPALLAEYRERGTAEGHQGELMSVLAPLLSSTVRPKSTYAGQAVVNEYPSVDAFAVNEVRLLLNALAYNLMHVARTLTEKATDQGWGLERFRERMLKVAARVLVHERRATFVISRGVAQLWMALWQQIGRLEWAPSG
jgi:hypothetical protein